MPFLDRSRRILIDSQRRGPRQKSPMIRCDMAGRPSDIDRRAFLESVVAAGALPIVQRTPVDRAAADGRVYWIDVLRRLSDPVLSRLARMPIEQAAGADRAGVTRLEALGRLTAGIAPWLELGADGEAEGRLRRDYAERALRAIARAVDPASPEFLNFTRDRQPLVDAAFLAQGILRSPHVLRDGLEPASRRHLIAA